ncbi:MAG: Clp protease ClpP, partial [Roseovarius sp.]|nr:Clp protease ClpP [Roseovarius sp.]
MEPDELMIDGELVLHGDVGEGFFGPGLTARGVISALAGAEGDLLVRLNSGGGDAWEGAAIHAALKAYPGDITVRVEGIAASAASLIAMAGDVIEMAEGSIMMIHDPRNVSVGTSEDHRRSAAVLDKLADTYAGVYARRAGMKTSDARAIMVAETWFSPDEAVSAGFAGVVMETHAMEMAAFDYRLYSKAPKRLLRMSTKFGRQSRRPDNGATAPKMQEADMPEQETKAAVKAPVAETPEVKAEVDKVSNDGAKASVSVEMRVDPVSERRAAVTERFGDRMTAREVEDIAKKAKDAPAALMAAAEMLIDRQVAASGPEMRETAVITDDGDERRFNAMCAALHGNVFGRGVPAEAAEYRGLTMKGLAMDLSGRKGHAWNDMDRVRAGMSAQNALVPERMRMSGAMHSTSDFAFITGEIVNRALRAEYQSRQGSWSRIGSRRTATDFRSLHSVQSGVDTDMRRVLESGEYEGTVIVDAGETFRVERFGRVVTLTFEAVVNDDLGAFARLPQQFARGARNLESRIAWGLVTANGNMADGTAIFAAGRGNLAGTGGVISVAAVGAGRSAMMIQKPLGAKSGTADFIAAVPDLLIVPPALDVAARQFANGTIVATKDADSNPLKGTVEVVADPFISSAVSGGS